MPERQRDRGFEADELVLDRRAVLGEHGAVQLLQHRAQAPRHLHRGRAVAADLGHAESEVLVPAA